MYYFDLYDSFVLANRREVVTRLVGVLGCAFVALAVLYYVFPEVSLGGSTLWVGVGIVGIAVPTWRRLFSVLNRSARFSERAIVYGDGPLAEPLMAEIANRVGTGCPRRRFCRAECALGRRVFPSLMATSKSWFWSEMCNASW